MVAAKHVLVSIWRPVAVVPESLQAPLLGSAWVLFNIFLVCLGIRVNCPIACSVLAGSLSCTIIAMIAVTMLSHKFQAGVTGLLGGYSFNNLVNGFAPGIQAAANLHHLLDEFLALLPGPHDERFHEAIQDAVMWIVLTVVFVVLAALIVQWIRTEDGSARTSG